MKELQNHVFFDMHTQTHARNKTVLKTILNKKIDYKYLNFRQFERMFESYAEL